jgi:hypothetical protein
MDWSCSRKLHIILLGLLSASHWLFDECRVL